MKDITELTAATRDAESIITDLKQKSVVVPGWSDLEKEYNPKKHPIMTDPSYTDKVTKTGIEKVTRITIDLQRLAAKRMTELAFGIPVKRIYNSETEGEKAIAKIIEKVYKRNRINSLNTERGKMLFAGCEVVTLWYAVEEKNNLYGIDSALKLRCKNYSPMNGDSLYPLFDEYDDLKALSFDYTRYEAGATTQYFDTYTATEHIRWTVEGGKWVEQIRETTTIGKIPAVYITRPTPIWEDTSNNVFELEWSLSRNGNYLRKNSKPIFAIFADGKIKVGDEKNDDSRLVVQYPQGSSANYVTWQQAVESLKFHHESLYKAFFTQLQLPDMSYESMKSTPMSGEARKMMFIDCQLKVTDESGRWLEALDRETNVIKAFLKTILPEKQHADIDSLEVETVITPYAVTDDKDTITNLISATGGKAIMSQLEGIKNLGWSDNPEETLRQIDAEAAIANSNPTF